MGRKRRSETENELNQPIWAVVDGARCFGTDLTYDEALEVVDNNKNSLTVIVTKDVAQRINKQ